MRRLLVMILLLFATTFSGAADAALRAVGPQSQAVICAEGRAVTITLGADGLPAEPRGNHGHCPDCLPLPLSATGASAGPAPACPVGRVVLSARPAASPCRGPAFTALPEARGPPLRETS